MILYGQSRSLKLMNVITNKQWQKQQQPQLRLTLSQKYPDQEFMLKPRLLSQRDLRTTEKVIKNKVDNQKVPYTLL